MRYLNLIGFLAILVANSTSYLFPQALRGQVLMPDGSPAQREIRLVLDDAEGKRINEILYTDSNGRFTFLTIPDGFYRITITSDGPEFSDTVYTRQVDSNRYIVITLNPPKREKIGTSLTTSLGSIPKSSLLLGTLLQKMIMRRP